MLGMEYACAACGSSATGTAGMCCEMEREESCEHCKEAMSNCTCETEEMEGDAESEE